MKPMSRKMRERLDVIWAKGAPIGGGLQLAPMGGAPDRYIPRALGAGPGWRVFDRKLSRVLTDNEVSRLSVAELRDEKFVH